MKGLYVVINETKDGKYLGECPLLKGYTVSGTSLTEVKENMLKAVSVYLESNINLMDSKKAKDIESKKIIRGYKSSIVPKW